MANSRVEVTFIHILSILQVHKQPVWQTHKWSKYYY